MTKEVLDVACGRRRDGTVNIDLDVNVRLDIVCDMHFLPFRKESFDEAILGQVEHTLEPNLLIAGCYAVKHRGIVKVSVPNFVSFTVLLDWFRKKPTYSRSLILGAP